MTYNSEMRTEQHVLEGFVLTLIGRFQTWIRMIDYSCRKRTFKVVDSYHGPSSIQVESRLDSLQAS